MVGVASWDALTLPPMLAVALYAGLRKGELFGLDETVPKPTPLEALKLIQCLEYQSNQNPDYYATQAFRTLHEIRRVAQSKLPGWDQASWDLV